MKKVKEKLRKRDRALNVVKSGVRKARKFYQKIQPISNKLKPIINPRNALFGLILVSILNPKIALAAVGDGGIPPAMPPGGPPVPNMPFGVPGDSLDDLPGWKGNMSMALFLAAVAEETTYHTSSMVPGMTWFNSRIAAPVAAISTYACIGGAVVCHSVGWHNKGWKCTSTAASCTGYIIGAHRAAPTDPALAASRAATAPFEAALKAEEGRGLG